MEYHIEIIRAWSRLENVDALRATDDRGSQTAPIHLARDVA
jgi:hypothetical protein